MERLSTKVLVPGIIAKKMSYPLNSDWIQNSNGLTSSKISAKLLPTVYGTFIPGYRAVELIVLDGDEDKLRQLLTNFIQRQAFLERRRLEEGTQIEVLFCVAQRFGYRVRDRIFQEHRHIISEFNTRVYLNNQELVRPEVQTTGFPSNRTYLNADGIAENEVVFHVTGRRVNVVDTGTRLCKIIQNMANETLPSRRFNVPHFYEGRNGNEEFTIEPVLFQLNPEWEVRPPPIHIVIGEREHRAQQHRPQYRPLLVEGNGQRDVGIGQNVAEEDDVVLREVPEENHYNIKEPNAEKEKKEEGEGNREQIVTQEKPTNSLTGENGEQIFKQAKKEDMEMNKNHVKITEEPNGDLIRETVERFFKDHNREDADSNKEIVKTPAEPDYNEELIPATMYEANEKSIGREGGCSLQNAVKSATDYKTFLREEGSQSLLLSPSKSLKTNQLTTEEEVQFKKEGSQSTQTSPSSLVKEEDYVAKEEALLQEKASLTTPLSPSRSIESDEFIAKEESLLQEKGFQSPLLSPSQSFKTNQLTTEEETQLKKEGSQSTLSSPSNNLKVDHSTEWDEAQRTDKSDKYESMPTYGLQNEGSLRCAQMPIDSAYRNPSVQIQDFFWNQKDSMVSSIDIEDGYDDESYFNNYGKQDLVQDYYKYKYVSSNNDAGLQLIPKTCFSLFDAKGNVISLVQMNNFLSKLDVDIFQRTKDLGVQIRAYGNENVIELYGYQTIRGKVDIFAGTSHIYKRFEPFEMNFAKGGKLKILEKFSVQKL